MGGDDLRVIFGGRVDVMVVGRDPRLFELAGFVVIELAEGHADLHAELAHLANGLEHGLEATVTRANTLPRRAHAKAR